jgi:hypothetical protein
LPPMFYKPRSSQIPRHRNDEIQELLVTHHKHRKTNTSSVSKLITYGVATKVLLLFTWVGYKAARFERLDATRLIRSLSQFANDRRKWEILELPYSWERIGERW